MMSSKMGSIEKKDENENEVKKFGKKREQCWEVCTCLCAKIGWANTYMICQLLTLVLSVGPQTLLIPFVKNKDWYFRSWYQVLSLGLSYAPSPYSFYEAVRNSDDDSCDSLNKDVCTDSVVSLLSPFMWEADGKCVYSCPFPEDLITYHLGIGVITIVKSLFVIVLGSISFCCRCTSSGFQLPDRVQFWKKWTWTVFILEKLSVCIAYTWLAVFVLDWQAVRTGYLFCEDNFKLGDESLIDMDIKECKYFVLSGYCLLDLLIACMHYFTHFAIKKYIHSEDKKDWSDTDIITGTRSFECTLWAGILQWHGMEQTFRDNLVCLTAVGCLHLASDDGCFQSTPKS